LTELEYFAGDDIEAAQRVLGRGGVLAVPTESSWGLAVDPTKARAVEQIFVRKGRDDHKPLPVVAAGVEQILALGVAADDPGLALGLRFWPAPLSVLVRLPEALAATRGAVELAVRIPVHDGLRALLRGCGRALTATSANRSGAPAICDAADLVALLEPGVDGVWGGGILPGGLPSTLVRCRPDGTFELLRPGRFAWPPTSWPGPA
jgi:L-threonylcarbamoyladenylate synthase